MLRAWGDAPAFILSCPGPLRRHHAAVLPISQLRLPQCLLGGEAQMQALAAALPDLAPRLFFTPLPELFSAPASLAALYAATGVDGSQRLVHLRFGGTRSARLVKDARNGLVLAENHHCLPITASRHPFASGLVLPAIMRRVFAYDSNVARPATIDGAEVPLTPIEATALAADLPMPRGRGKAMAAAAATDGLEVVSLAEFRSNAWAAGPVRARSPHLRAALAAARLDGAPFVLLPWNLDHPGSTVPHLIERTLRLQSLAAPTVRLVVMPFNYPGQTGLIRRMIRQLRGKAEEGAEALAHVFIGRLTDLHALPDLLALTRVAWVDGNDPEYDWTTRRLAACGIAPILLAASSTRAPAGVIEVAADEDMTLEAETAFGLLHFRTQLPSLRALRQLFPLTRALVESRPRKRGRAARA